MRYRVAVHVFVSRQELEYFEVEVLLVYDGPYSWAN